MQWGTSLQFYILKKINEINIEIATNTYKMNSQSIEEYIYNANSPTLKI